MLKKLRKLYLLFPCIATLLIHNSFAVTGFAMEYPSSLTIANITDVEQPVLSSKGTVNLTFTPPSPPPALNEIVLEFSPNKVLTINGKTYAVFALNGGTPSLTTAIPYEVVYERCGPESATGSKSGDASKSHLVFDTNSSSYLNTNQLFFTANCTGINCSASVDACNSNPGSIQIELLPNKNPRIQDGTYTAILTLKVQLQ